MSASMFAKEVNVYSARHYDTDIALYDTFTKRTGITVNLIEGGSDALIERIVNEGEFTPADILITVDAGRLWRAQQRGVFQPVESEILESRVPAHLRETNGHWFGLSKRARVIVYRKDAALPIRVTRYEDLSNEALRGLICMRSSSNIYNLSLMASLLDAHASDVAKMWASGVVENFARDPQGNDTSNVTAVSNGVCGLTIANTYYLGRFLASDSESDRELANSLAVVFPNQDDRGTHVNISGAGITKHAPNRDHAIQFLEYLTDDYAQRLFAEGNNEYPVVGHASGTVAELGEFKEDEIRAQLLGENQAAAVRVYDLAGWR
ncbi:MAG: Fe(3+) ABC transporter substrate-binding protein [Gammaproteobacteria bacterium]|nr:Fe(3+) ABC transporter substrate-binding protein [Gammaproteobacteria bacterium]